MTSADQTARPRPSTAVVVTAAQSRTITVVVSTRRGAASVPVRARTTSASPTRARRTPASISGPVPEDAEALDHGCHARLLHGLGHRRRADPLVRGDLRLRPALHEPECDPAGAGCEPRDDVVATEEVGVHEALRRSVAVVRVVVPGPEERGPAVLAAVGLVDGVPRRPPAGAVLQGAAAAGTDRPDLSAADAEPDLHRLGEREGRCRGRQQRVGERAVDDLELVADGGAQGIEGGDVSGTVERALDVVLGCGAVRERAGVDQVDDHGEHGLGLHGLSVELHIVESKVWAKPFGSVARAPGRADG
ncbi:hypothetical protein Q9Q99_01430 [Curtobacterium flaccumfaciens]|nr:hypothetical protein Q9Q99_01430 [Curtobacterium flaccumfaciens]